MKRIMAAILATVMALMGLTGCRKTEPQPVIPETPELPGTLVGMSYATGSGMMAHSEFYIRLNRREVEAAEFWPEDEYVEDIKSCEHIPITEKQWADVEAVILDLYLDGMMEAYQPKPKPENNPMDAFILDGGNYTNLSLLWKTADGTQEIDYHWPGDRRVLTLTGLLQELADPQGREIPRYEKRQLDEIYITRKYKLNQKKNYSFQLHLVDFIEDQEPYWELIYYLGEWGVGPYGTIPLEDSVWDDFLTLAESTQLEYFPEQTKSNDRFRCTLYYTDETCRYILLNEKTEQALYDFFMGLTSQ